MQERKSDEELEDFLTYMRKNNPFYGKYIPKDLDLNEMPVIDKNIVLKNYNAIKMQTPFKIGKTSGTTGQPLQMLYTKVFIKKSMHFGGFIELSVVLKLGIE